MIEIYIRVFETIIKKIGKKSAIKITQKKEKRRVIIDVETQQEIIEEIDDDSEEIFEEN